MSTTSTSTGTGTSTSTIAATSTSTSNEILPAPVVDGRVTMFREISSVIPKNENGLPQYIYRPDLVPPNLPELSKEEQSQLLDVAAIEIIYSEGFPTLEDGTAIWERLGFEPDAHHKAFQAYLNMTDVIGIRRLEVLDKSSSAHAEYMALLNPNLNPTNNTTTNGSKPNNALNPLQGAVAALDYSREQLIEVSTYYSWAIRANAWDYFRFAQYQKIRERRALECTNSHYLTAERLLQTILPYFEEVDDDGTLVCLADMTPRVALDFFERLTKIQRLSAGLGASSITETDKPQAFAANIDTLFRRIATNSQDISADGQATESTEETRARLQQLLQDPQNAEAVQRLAIQLSQITHNEENPRKDTSESPPPPPPPPMPTGGAGSANNI